MSKSFERKADAERHLVDMQHRLLTGTYAPPRLGRTPFSEVALRYRQRGNWRRRTHRTVEERLRYAIAHFGDRPIASIRKGDVQSFVSGLPLAPNTVKVVMQHVSGVFNTALDDGLLGGRNPCDGVRLPRVDAPPIFPMSIEQSRCAPRGDDRAVQGGHRDRRRSRLAPVRSGRAHRGPRRLPSPLGHDRSAVAASDGLGDGNVHVAEDRGEYGSCRSINGCSTISPRTSTSTASAPTVCSSIATACRSTRPSSATSCERLGGGQGCRSRSRSTTCATSSPAP